MELFVFKVEDEYMGINARYIQRVVDDVEVTPVPIPPPCHIGLLYNRGELFDVIDVVCLLGAGKAEVKGNFRVILMKWSDKKIALVADRIIGLLWMEEDNKTDSVYEQENYTVRQITPEDIWNKLVKNPYGPPKISKDIQPGIREIS